MTHERLDIVNLIENNPLEKLSKLEGAVVPLKDELSEEYGLEILTKLRQNNIFAEMPTNESLNKRMKKADKLGAKFAIIIGETEVKNKSVTVKN